MKLYWNARNWFSVNVSVLVNGVQTIDTCLFDLHDVSREGEAGLRGRGRVIGNLLHPVYRGPYLEPDGETVARWEVADAEVILRFGSPEDRESAVRLVCSEEEYERREQGGGRP